MSRWVVSLGFRSRCSLTSVNAAKAPHLLTTSTRLDLRQLLLQRHFPETGVRDRQLAFAALGRILPRLPDRECIADRHPQRAASQRNVGKVEGELFRTCLRELDDLIESSAHRGERSIGRSLSRVRRRSSETPIE